MFDPDNEIGVVDRLQLAALTLTMEECAEVIQRCTKIIRFGSIGCWHNGRANTESLSLELGDLLAAVRLLAQYSLINMDDVDELAHQKLQTLKASPELLRLAGIP